ncbi:type III secretion inner membrane ring lipoprotein SctJ [Achromobacter xylosoxidans]|uniref:type III secretion system inner membrane ring lipoprotein SctJ n=1 Tax=Alcaligenes xylosoxydans xylosoxydans TaxID=85698 RepID=UPI00324597D0
MSLRTHEFRRLGARRGYRRVWLIGSLLLLLAMLTACGARVDLLAAVPESEANEVLSVLLDAGIAAQKSAGKAGVAINVQADQVAQALAVLRARGLPRERFDGMGQIFRKEGLVSSPLEERARYIYALSQELANTLSQMDGVIAARVHVVLPERGGVGEEATPSTAAVFIKTQPGYALDALLPQIRRLVIHAIPGLSEDKVSVALINAQPAAARAQAPTARGDEGRGASPLLFGALVGVGVALLLALLAAGGWFAWRRAPHSLRDRLTSGKRAVAPTTEPDGSVG